MSYFGIVFGNFKICFSIFWKLFDVFSWRFVQMILVFTLTGNILTNILIVSFSLLRVSLEYLFDRIWVMSFDSLRTLQYFHEILHIYSWYYLENEDTGYFLLHGMCRAGNHFQDILEPFWVDFSMFEKFSIISHMLYRTSWVYSSGQ